MTLVELVNLAANEDDIDSDEFNEVLAKIQHVIGQDDGGFAGVWFSGLTDNRYDSQWTVGDEIDKKRLIADYIRDELINMTDAIIKKVQ